MGNAVDCVYDARPIPTTIVMFLSLPFRLFSRMLGREGSARADGVSFERLQAMSRLGLTEYPCAKRTTWPALVSERRASTTR